MGRLRRVVAALPHGNSLPEDVWRRRHGLMIWLVWSQAVGLGIFGLAQGLPVWHALLETVPIATCALAAQNQRFSRRMRTGFVAIGLLTSSAMLVHVWEGQIEAHFHFFVMVTILATYEEWFPYLLGVGYVVLHHGAAGVLDAGSVYNHHAAIADPWKWAGIHGLFVAGLGVANIVTWRMNEEVRDQTRASEARFRTAFDDAPIGMALVDTDGRFLRVNRRLAALTGYSTDELLEMSLDGLTADGEGWRPLGHGGGEEERRLRRADGTAAWCLWQHTRVEEAEPYYICQFLDVTRRKDAETELSYRAQHDPLTTLPNRAMFVERLEAALSKDSSGVAVIFVDIDDFKLINDSLGHGAGDRLLVDVGERLGGAVRPTDLLARFGGDEFTVCLEGVSDERHARQVADRLASALRAPFVVDGQQRFISASFGIKLSDGDTSAESLLADADAAMYRAKELGKARCEVFNDTMRSTVVERLELETGLRDALANGELRLVYQPAVILETGRVAGVEALLRWDHPTLGLVPPLSFVPIAERTGIIVPIGAWVLEEACRQLAAWDRQEGTSAESLVMSVNVSARQLVFGGLVDDVRRALDGAGVAPERLCLEVTESAVIADPETALRTLTALKDLGVGLAIDDFGIGYSSLGNLRDLLPVDVLKIDRSFVDGVNDRSDDRAIVEAVLRLADSLGLQAIAEGVENADQADALRALGCTHAQGYHYARPGEPDAINQLLRHERFGELLS